MTTPGNDERSNGLFWQHAQDVNIITGRMEYSLRLCIALDGHATCLYGATFPRPEWGTLRETIIATLNSSLRRSEEKSRIGALDAP